MNGSKSVSMTTKAIDENSLSIVSFKRIKTNGNIFNILKTDT